jgi:hypothetical protein
MLYSQKFPYFELSKKSSNSSDVLPLVIEVRETDAIFEQGTKVKKVPVVS